MTKTVTHIEVPEKWKSTDDFNSHRELLYLTLKNTTGRVIEVGMGFGSSPLISWECYEQHRHFEAFETNKDWWEKVSMKASGDTTGTTWCKDYVTAIDEYLKPDSHLGVMFIDCAPASERKLLIEKYRDYPEVMITHDTEQGSVYVYDMEDNLNQFKYRLNYEPIGNPHSCVVSNKIDVTKWI